MYIITGIVCMIIGIIIGMKWQACIIETECEKNYIEYARRKHMWDELSKKINKNKKDK